MAKKKAAVESEAALARSVVTELQRLGYETYEEVALGYGSKRADVVGVRGPVVAIVECKTAMSLRLLDQLCEWDGYAHYLIGAVPYYRRGRAVFRLLHAIGAGLWSVGQYSDSGLDVREDIAPQLRRRADTRRLLRSLNPAQRSGQMAQAGTNGGGYWTPFAGTCRAIADTVREAPGITLREALAKAGHHYSSTKSALSAMPALIRKGVVAGVWMEDGRAARLYPKPVGDQAGAPAPETTQ